MPISLVGRFLCGLLCCLPLLRAQADPNQLLLEIRRKVAQSISHLPNYLCTEIVERQTFQPDFLVHARKASSCEKILASDAKSHKLASMLATSDRLRLDVALGGGKEMYSWVGEGRFDDRSLSEIVKQGTTSTGAFGSFLHAIFVSDSAIFTFKGESAAAGQRVLEYAFEVPLTRSGYMVSNETVTRLTSYTGTFTVNAKTLDLLRLEIRTDPLPPELDICQSTTTLDYTKVRMSAADVLLPSVVDVRMVASDGHESHNRTLFSGCHQFLGESRLIFDDAPATGTPTAAAASAALNLSAGLKVSVALAQSVDPATAAAGDPATGRLTGPLKDPTSGLTIPKGAKVNGRIFGLLSYYGAGNELEFGLKWESVEWEGVTHPLELTVRSAASLSAKLPLFRGRWLEVRAMTRPEQPGVAFFLFPQIAKDYQIPAGFEADWVTVPAAQPEK
jgi:hypothetical protein